MIFDNFSIEKGGKFYVQMSACAQFMPQAIHGGANSFLPAAFDDIKDAEKTGKV